MEISSTIQKGGKKNTFPWEMHFMMTLFSSHLHMVGKGWWCTSCGSICCIKLLVVHVIAALIDNRNTSLFGLTFKVIINIFFWTYKTLVKHLESQSKCTLIDFCIFAFHILQAPDFLDTFFIASKGLGILHVWCSLFEIFTTFIMSLRFKTFTHDLNQFLSSNYHHVLWITNSLFGLCHTDEFW